MDAEYELSVTIHEGPDTIVCRGYRRADRAPVVIKLLRDEHASPRKVARIRHEYAILRSLEGSGVVRAYGLTRHRSGLALVLEDFGARSLSESGPTGGRRRDWQAAVRIAAFLARTLESIHRRGVIHKDIKPHNIVVNEETQEVKLIDFGIASRLAQEVQRGASPASLEGTLAYMSPEQTGRMNRAIDHRSDLYSLGVTLYELLTGALPFVTTDPLDLIQRHLAEAPVPPHDRAPEVPRAVSNIVMKLLAKEAEDRYQRAAGLEADLEECLSRWEREGQVAPFPLGQRDFDDALRIPQRLYGREAELAVITAAWDRACEGRAGLVLVSGSAGAGKSALVHELDRAITSRRGLFSTGKFSQLSQSAPYAPLAQALGDLARQLLAEREEALARWTTRLQAALGPDAQVMIDLVPELGRILGPQPAALELGPAEAQNRFHLLFQNLLRAFTAEQRPLVIFLDDLQWADPASLKLLQVLLSDPELGYLLVVGAYRSGEVDAGHPMRLAVGEIRKSGAAVHEVALGPLGLADVAQLSADALGCERERALPLAKALHRATQGNPFFVGQLLDRLHQEKAIWFDEASGAFAWDLARVEAASVTDDVIAFMADRLRRLAPETQRLLELAACIGYRFDLATLASVSERTPAAAAADLWEALAQGLVVPMDPEYRFLHDAVDQDDGGAAPAAAFEVSYRFLHDQVQQAAYSLREGTSRQEAHLRIGRLLLERHGGRPGDEALHDVVAHLNLGAALITDPRERIELSRLNLAAGRKARASAAHQAAAGYLRTGMSLLARRPAIWDEDHALAWALHEERATCEHLTGHPEEAERLFDVLLVRARSPREQAHVHHLRVVLYMSMGRIGDAVVVGLRALALLGVDLPEAEEDRRAAVDAELAQTEALLGGRRPEALLDLPPLEAPDGEVVLALFTSLFIPAFIVSPTLFTLVAARHVNLSLRHGHADASPHGYMAYGFILASFRGRYREAYEFGQLALDLNARRGNVDLDCRLNAMFGDYMHYRRPLRDGLACAARAYHAGLRSGDFIHLSYACTQAIVIRLALGDDLDEVREELGRYQALMQRIDISSSSAVQAIAEQMIANLTGQTRGRGTLSHDGFDEEGFVDGLTKAGLAFVAFRYHVVKLQLLYLHGDYKGALAMAALGEATAATSVGQWLTTELPFYTCLTLAALYPEAPRDEQRRYAAVLAEHQAKIAAWAESCPDNFRHKHLLVQAEAARIAGRDVEAMELYDQAIEAAGQSGFVRDEALANELSAKFRLSQGRTRMARTFMVEAHHGYLRWGATAKAENLAAEHPDLLAPAAEKPEGLRVQATITSTLTVRLDGQLLDVSAVIRAAQAISGEIVLDKVLERLLRVAVESTGAQRGALILERDGRLLLEASMDAPLEPVTVGRSIPLEACADLPVTVVQHAARAGEPVVLRDAASAEGKSFAGDPYLIARGPRSLLCLALAHHGRQTGILYLENRDVRGAFTRVRVELCGLLAAQAAIAIDNALLYARLGEATAQLRQSNEHLEDEVARRTTELRSELAERRRVEEELLAQAERVLELSTPLVPITDRIVAMPLIGTLDAERARRMTDTALQGASASGAAVVIVDITGVTQVDAEVANSLGSTAAALRLIGAEVVITGIRADVARMLVERSIEMGSVVTRGTLQSGITYALARTGGGLGWAQAPAPARRRGPLA